MRYTLTRQPVNVVLLTKVNVIPLIKVNVVLLTNIKKAVSQPDVVAVPLFDIL